MLLVVILTLVCFRVTFAASSLNTYLGRPEPRSSSGIASQAASSATAVTANDQELAGSKVTEHVGGSVFSGYPVPSQAQLMSGPFTGPVGMNSYIYGGSPSPGSNHILGVSSNGDLTLQAYFSPVVWGFVAGLAGGVVMVFLINLFGGFEWVGGAIRGIGAEKKSAAKARSIDLDQIASIVYTAMEKYNKWNTNPKENLF